MAPATWRCGRGTGALVVFTMAVDFNEVVVAPLAATASGASLTPLQPPIARIVPVPPLHRWFYRVEIRFGATMASLISLGRDVSAGPYVTR